MATPLLFISYRHAEPSTLVQRKLALKLGAIAEGAGFGLYIDEQVISAGDSWRESIDEALPRSTHFLCLLTDEYWASPECRRELHHAVAAFESSGTPKLLFVLVQAMRPDYLSFAGARRSGKLVSEDPTVRNVGDINFLGPFNEQGQLVPLATDNAVALDRQLGQLVNRLLPTLPRGD